MKMRESPRESQRPQRSNSPPMKQKGGTEKSISQRRGDLQVPEFQAAEEPISATVATGPVSPSARPNLAYPYKHSAPPLLTGRAADGEE